jgi:hypothetical protein
VKQTRRVTILERHGAAGIFPGRQLRTLSTVIAQVSVTLCPSILECRLPGESM